MASIDEAHVVVAIHWMKYQTREENPIVWRAMCMPTVFISATIQTTPSRGSYYNLLRISSYTSKERSKYQNMFSFHFLPF